MGSIDQDEVALLRQRYGATGAGSSDAHPWSPTISLMLKHSSVRYFLSDETLPDGTLETLMAAAQSASTGSLLQTWSVVAVTDVDRKKDVALLCGDQDFIRQAPLFLLFCADLGRLADASEAHGRPGQGEGLERIDLFVMASLDAAMAAQNAAIAAESLGLGMCYVGGARNNARQLTEYLNLPDRVIGLFGMAVGKADMTRADSPKPRLPMDGVLHMETWNGEARKRASSQYDEILQAHYGRQRKEGRIAWTQHLANFVASGDLDGRGRLRGVLDDQGFAFS